jgi:hypothetical protein
MGLPITPALDEELNILPVIQVTGGFQPFNHLADARGIAATLKELILEFSTGVRTGGERPQREVV